MFKSILVFFPIKIRAENGENLWLQINSRKSWTIFCYWTVCVFFLGGGKNLPVSTVTWQRPQDVDQRMWLLGWNMEVTSSLGTNTIIYDINRVPEGCGASFRHTVRSCASQSSCLSFAFFFKSLLWPFYRIRRRGRALWIIPTAAQWQSPTHTLSEVFVREKEWDIDRERERVKT